MSHLGPSNLSLRIIGELLPDMEQSITRFTVLAGPADHDLQKFFLDHLEQMLPTIRDALEQGDLATVHRHAHSLKGSGGSVGFPEISALCESLEEQCRKNLPAEAHRLADGLARWWHAMVEDRS